MTDQAATEVNDAAALEQEPVQEPAQDQAEQQAQVGNRTVAGRVVSDAGDKSITLVVERRVRHPLYGKYVRRSSKLHAHDEANECKVGDLVRVEQCRPLSKTKRWKLIEIVEKAR